MTGTMRDRRLLVAVLAVAALAVALLPAPHGTARAQQATSPDGCPGDRDPAPFTDRNEIPETHRRNVDCVYAKGITRGFADNTFRAGLPVPRDQLASFLARTIDEMDGARALPDAGDQGFTDIEGNTHGDNINRLAEAGIIEGGPGGTPASSYGPGLHVRRDQVASLVLRAAAWGLDEDLADWQSDEQRFPDVPPGNAHFANVNGAAEAGLVLGRSTDQFGAAASTRRDQMASLMARLLAVAPERPGPEDPDPPEPIGAVESLRLHVAPEHLDELYSRDPRSDDRLPGSASHSAVPGRLNLDGFRFRGSSSRFLPKKSFNIRFTDRQPFLFGSDRMNANAMYTDPSMMRERLAMGLFRALDQPASRTHHTNLWLNSVYEGLYVHVERVDSDLLANAGLSEDGTLVRDGFRDNEQVPQSAFGYDLSQVDDPEGFLEENFDSRGDPDWGDLAELVQWVHDTPVGAGYDEGFRDRVDVDNFIDWLAIHFLIGDIDSFGDDYWLHRDQEPEGRWAFIPWDKDLSFGSHFRPGTFTFNDFFGYEYSLQSGWDNELIRKFLATDSLRSELHGRLEELMRTFDDDYFAERIARIGSEIRESVERRPVAGEAFVRHPQNHFGALGRFDYHQETLRTFVELRYAYIGRQLDWRPGPRNTASVTVTEDDGGERLLLTDEWGWTVAAFDVEGVSGAGELSVTVTQHAGLDGVDRVWALDTDVDELSGSLTVFYRNEFLSPDPGILAENWYDPERDREGVHPDAIEDQWDLVLAEFDGASVTALPDSTANPYVNRVTAPVRLAPGTSRFVAVHG